FEGLLSARGRDCPPVLRCGVYCAKLAGQEERRMKGVASSKWSFAILLAGSLVMAACGSNTPSTGGTHSNFLACMVTDTGGIDDRSFNQSAWLGLQNAKKDLGVQIKNLSATFENNYDPNITAFENQKCGIIVTVGFAMGDITKKKAAAAPDQKFAI